MHALGLLSIAMVLIAVSIVGAAEPAGFILPPPPLPCFTSFDDYEDDDKPWQSTLVKLPFGEDELLACEDDQDWFAFSAPPGAKIVIHADFEHTHGDIDLDLRVFSGLIATSWSVTDDEDISIIAPNSHEFLLGAYLISDSDGFGNDYSLEIDIVCPPAVQVGDAFTDALGESMRIPDSPRPGAIDCFEVLDAGAGIDGLTVGLDIRHQLIGELKVTLEHVDTGTAVTLIDMPGDPPARCAGDDISATFADDASANAEEMCGATAPAIGGTVRPAESLSAFDGETLAGTWRLQVTDAAPSKFGGGLLSEWWIHSAGSSPTDPPSADTDTPTPTNTPTNTPTDTPTGTPTPTAVPPTAVPEITETPTFAAPTATSTVLPSGDLGDANCDDTVNSIDAALVLQFNAALLDSLDCQDAADVNDDGDITSVDAALILQLTAGLIGSLPP